MILDRYVYRQLPKVLRSIHTVAYKKQNQLFIHTTDNATKAKLSFSSNPIAMSTGTITLPSAQLSNEEPEAKDALAQVDISTDIFSPTPGFLSLLNQVIQENVHLDFTYMIEAQCCPGSYMPIYDLRSVPRYGRTPELENTFGFVGVDDQGKIIPNSFQENYTYSIVDSADGVLVLSDFLNDQLKEKLKSL